MEQLQSRMTLSVDWSLTWAAIRSIFLRRVTLSRKLSRHSVADRRRLAAACGIIGNPANKQRVLSAGMIHAKKRENGTSTRKKEKTGQVHAKSRNHPEFAEKRENDKKKHAKKKKTTPNSQKKEKTSQSSRKKKDKTTQNTRKIK